MKKIFNLAFVVASFMGAAVFTSCDKEDKEDNIIEEFEDEDSDAILKSEQLTVVMGQKYAAYNSSIDGGALNFTVTNTTIEGDDKTVTFTVDLKGDEADGKSFTIGDADDMPSYFGRVDGKLQACKQKIAVDNAKNIIFALSNDAQACVITSATVNKSVSAAGATETQFGTYVNKK